VKESYFSIFATFLKFGALAWGGPVAQIAMIREELVEKRQWITPDKFQRTLAVYQALPGPEAHELCVYFGMIRKGRLGGVLAGLGFMLPGLLLILLLAAAYVQYGAETLLPLFVGVAPAVTALIVRAVHHLGHKTLLDIFAYIIALTAVILTLVGVHFLAVFLVVIAAEAARARWKDIGGYIALAGFATIGVALAFVQAAPEITFGTAGNLFVEGLKAGMLSFGGAYTAIPFLRDGMVGVYPGVSMEAFLDSIALSNVVPAPLVIFGTFLGFLAGGLSGALMMTGGIFLPAFSFTLVGHHYLEKVIDNTALHRFLDSIAAAVIGILAVTMLEIAAHTLNGVLPVFLFAAALLALYLLRWKWVVPAVIVGCGIAGYALRAFVI